MGTGGRREKDHCARNPSRLAAVASRAAVLRGRNFRRFYAGYVTSLLGTSMSAVAVTFAVLGNGGSAADVGLVIAAQILPQVVLVLSGGVLADRLGRRPVMLGSDVLRCAAQAALAASLLAGRPGIWLIAALAALVGIG
jgi:MFS family permease